MTRPVLRGAFPVLCTPFFDDGTIATDDFDRVVDFALACGVDGVVYPGTASEVGSLSRDERSAMVKRLGERLAGRVPFIVGASAADPDEAAAHASEGARAGAAAAMAMAPHALGDDVAAHVGHFQRIADRVPVPIMLQNAPAPIGAGLLPEAVGEIARAVKGIHYVKEETQPCGQNLSRVQASAGAAIAGVFGGAGGRTVTDELARGALGTLPAVELADIHARLVHAWASGDVAEARRLFEVSLPALSHQAVFRMHMTKATLARRGVIVHTGVRASGPKMDAQDRAELHALLDRLAPELTLYPLASKDAA